MQLDLYKEAFQEYFSSDQVRVQIKESVEILREARRVIFIGNGGSNAISGHMMEDYMKIAGKQTLSFTDPSLITCFANDYGYDKAIAEWIKRSFQKDDVLVAISSSGESANILNAVDQHLQLQGPVITLSGFKEQNRLSGKGTVNFHVAAKNYGIVECFHQIILHAILDELA
jgi:D-sedoheptulose 7-phosphate isomerase